MALPREIESTYEVLSKMGEGGMGAVYKVRHRFFDELRVIKLMQPEMEAVDELKERFLGEAKRGKQLRHPNLAEVIDFSIAADGTSYIVMEYIEGVTLRELEARSGGAVDYRTLIPIAEQTLSALAYLHGKKFVHRDISPDNIMLTAGGGAEPRVKLIDLGIAKSLEATTSLTMAGKFIGKVNYAAPEQFGGATEPRSDLYSLGVVLYEALTGAKPITGHSPMNVINGHMNRPPRPFGETDPQERVPEAVRAAVLRALAKKPKDRFPNADAFAEALRSSLPAGERRTVEIPIVTKEAAPLAAADPALLAPTAPATVPAQLTEQVLEPTVATTPKRRRPSFVAIAAGLAIVLLFAIVALLRLRQPGEMKLVANIPIAQPPATTATAGTTMSIAVPVPVPVAEGRLLINALPWGEVTSIRDAAGREQLTRGSVETPYVLPLPAGPYKVQLTNPNSNASVVLDANVTANALSRVQATLDSVDVNEYVGRIRLER